MTGAGKACVPGWWSWDHDGACMHARAPAGRKRPHTTRKLCNQGGWHKLCVVSLHIKAVLTAHRTPLTRTVAHTSSAPPVESLDVGRKKSGKPCSRENIRAGGIFGFRK